MTEGPSDRELLEGAEHNTNVILQQLRRATQQLRDVAIIANGEVLAFDRRRVALEHAHNFTKNAGNMGIVNHATVLYMAKQYDDFLKDGSLPDMEGEAKELAGFVWNYLVGAFPAEVIKKIKADAGA